MNNTKQLWARASDGRKTLNDTEPLWERGLPAKNDNAVCLT
ncbi:hypothetical protein [Pseudomonas frederiksbergensis]|nr:hypothetical protein [Pseudomonas frederiksbergensis]